MSKLDFVALCEKIETRLRAGPAGSPEGLSLRSLSLDCKYYVCIMTTQGRLRITKRLAAWSGFLGLLECPWFFYLSKF